MSKTNSINIDKFIKEDKIGKYYLMDSDRYKTKINGVSRIDAYHKLVDDKVINVNKIKEIGFINFVKSINAILDGSVAIGRFKFYIVYNGGPSLEEQIKIEQNIFAKGVDSK